MSNTQYIGQTAIVIEENDDVILGKAFIVECESDAHFMASWNVMTERYNIIINKGFCEIKND